MVISSIMDISQINEELIKNIREEEAMRLLKQIIKNNIMLLSLQRQILELQIVEDKKKGGSKRENREEEKIRKDRKIKKQKGRK